jgi:hypothetical protein
MVYRVLADLTLVVHLIFVLFVVLGGLIVFRRQWIAWLHIPAVIWGVLIELIGWSCPLTPLENYFSQFGGEAGYTGSFIEHYFIYLLYPSSLTRTISITLGLFVLVINMIIYILIYWRVHRTDGT